MQAYFANFIKKGDPNGSGLPAWPAVTSGKPVEIMRIDVDSRVEADKHKARYLFLDQL
jgi:para-nitrobenzyl esterase